MRDLLVDAYRREHPTTSSLDAEGGTTMTADAKDHTRATRDDITRNHDRATGRPDPAATMPIRSGGCRHRAGRPHPGRVRRHRLALPGRCRPRSSGPSRDVGVFRLLAPADVGGAEVDPVTFLKVVEAAAHADGSVGWCAMIGGCYAIFGGMLPHRGRTPHLRRPRQPSPRAPSARAAPPSRWRAVSG